MVTSEYRSYIIESYELDIGGKSAEYYRVKPSKDSVVWLNYEPLMTVEAAERFVDKLLSRCKMR